MKWSALLCSVAMFASGCAGGLWALGPPDDGPLPPGSVPNGLVLVSGAESWAEAGQEATLAWDGLLPEGLIFSSAEPNETMAGQAMTNALPVVWDDALIRPGHVSLDIDPAGMLVDIDVTLEPVEVVVEREGLPACYLEVAIYNGRLEGALVLTKSKLGVVNLSPSDEAAFRAGDAEVVLSSCHDDLRSRADHEEGPEALALRALATRAFEALTPGLSAAIPERLGLDRAGTMSVAYLDGGLGSGAHHSVVRAPLEGPSSWWQLAGGHLVVPYTVGVTSETHACAPEISLPVAASAPVPELDADWAMLVNQALVERHLHALWASGGLCGDRVGEGLTWALADWVESWPSLSSLNAESSLSVRGWPQSTPSVHFADDAAGQVELHLDTGNWRLELMGEREGARVLLASVQVVVVLQAQLSVSPEGQIWLVPTLLDVNVRSLSAGLLEAPSANAAAALVEQIVRDVLESTPFSGMLTLPVGLQPTIELLGAYVVIRDL